MPKAESHIFHKIMLYFHGNSVEVVSEVYMTHFLPVSPTVRDLNHPYLWCSDGCGGGSGPRFSHALWDFMQYSCTSPQQMETTKVTQGGRTSAFTSFICLNKANKYPRDLPKTKSIHCELTGLPTTEQLHL